VQQEMDGGLTLSQQDDFVEIANKCAGFDGPGVHIARASLGLAVSDGRLCGSLPESQQLILRVEESENLDQVYPNPVTIGGILSFQSRRTGWIEVYDALGHKVSARYLDDSSNYRLPATLGSGFYFIRMEDGTYSSRFVISE